MKKLSVIVKQVLMSTLSTAIIAMSFASCTDEADSINTNADSLSPSEGAKTELLEAYGLTYQNFDKADDVMIVDADTTQLSISKAYAEKMGIKSFVNHPMGVWHKKENLPYIIKATGEKVVGDRYIVDVVPATVAEIMGDKKVNLQTDIYVNNDASAVKTRAAGDNIPEYAAKYVDDNNVIHPAVIHMTDPYGYDKGYHTEDEQPSAAQTRAAQSGEYQYMTAEEMAGGQTRWGVKKRLLGFHDEMNRKFKLAAKGSKDSVYVNFGSEVDFELNYFLTLEGGVKWSGFLPSPYLEKFETGVDGHFDISAEVEFGFEKKWSLEDMLKKEICKFDAFSFTFFVGPVPVNISVSPNMFIKFDGEVSGKIVTGFSYKYGNEFMGGGSYTDKNGWKGIGYFRETANDFDITPATAKFKLTFGMGIYLGAEVKLYKVAGPEFAAGPRLGAKIEAVSSPFKAKEVSDLLDLNIEVGLDINAVLGAKLEVLGYNIVEKEIIIPMAGPWIIKKYPSDGTEHKVGDTDGVKQAAPTVKEWPNFYKAISASNYGPAFNDYMKQCINMYKEMNDCNDAKAREMIVTKLQTGRRSEPDASQYQFVCDDLADICNELKQQYRDFLYQKAATNGDNKTMSAMNWEDLIETLIQDGITGQGPAFLHSISDELHQMFVNEFHREPSKANAEDLHWLKQHIFNYDYYKSIQRGFNQEVFEGVVLPGLQRQFQSSFRKNATIAKEAAKEAYLDYLHDHQSQPETCNSEICSRFQKLFSVKYTAYIDAKEKDAADQKAKEEAEQQRKDDSDAMKTAIMHMHKAYFDKYGDEAGRGYTNAIQQFRHTMGRKPTTSAADMAKLSELFVSIMQSRGLTI